MKKFMHSANSSLQHFSFGWNIFMQIKPMDFTLPIGILQLLDWFYPSANRKEMKSKPHHASDFLISKLLPKLHKAGKETMANESFTLVVAAMVLLHFNQTKTSLCNHITKQKLFWALNTKTTKVQNKITYRTLANVRDFKTFYKLSFGLVSSKIFHPNSQV